jgi:hypothetical protein
MKRSTRSFAKKATNLSESVHQQLNKYALAAVVAVVSVLALRQPSEAKIVYTPVNIRIAPHQYYNLDLNHDGVTDFTISNGFGGICSKFIAVSELPAYGNSVISNGTFPAALMQGALIGHGQSFFEGSQRMAFAILMPQCRYVVEGPWANVTDRYLGLSFRRNGRTHYGWARLNVQWEYHMFSGFFASTLIGYAYETVADKSIIAGQTKGVADDSREEDFGPGASLTNPILDTLQPAALGVVALGAQGVPLWWRKESALEGDWFLVDACCFSSNWAFNVTSPACLCKQSSLVKVTRES